MDNIREQINGLINKFEKFKPECFSDNMQLHRDLGFDSIRLMSLVVEIEDIFGIQVEDEFLSEIYTATLKQLIEYIENLLNEK